MTYTSIEDQTVLAHDEPAPAERRSYKAAGLALALFAVVGAGATATSSRGAAQLSVESTVDYTTSSKVTLHAYVDAL